MTSATVADRWSVVVGAGLLSFVAMMEMSAMNVALPSTARDLGVTVGVAQFAIIGYQVALMVCLIPAGRLLGARPVRATVVGALVVFAAVGPIVALTPASATGVAWMSGWRVVQGVAAAVLFVCMPLLASTAVAPSKRGRALSVTAGLGSIGIVMGPVLAGPILDHLGWRAVPLLKIPVCLVAAAIVYRGLDSDVVSHSRPTSPSARVRGADRTPMRIVAAVALVASAASVLPLGVSIALQSAGRSATEAAVIMVVQSLVMAIVGILAGRAADRFGPSRLSAVGAGLVALGLAAMLVHAGDWTAFALSWRLGLVGLGMGLYGGPTQAWVMNLTAPQLMASAASRMQLARTAGFAVGPLVAASLWNLPMTPNLALVSAAASALAGCAVLIHAHTTQHS